jgi:hypothetical protein
MGKMPVDSPMCQYLVWSNTATLAFQREVIARNPASRLFVCGASCVLNGNPFLLDQNENIPWFCSTLMQAVQGITV